MNEATLNLIKTQFIGLREASKKVSNLTDSILNAFGINPCAECKSTDTITSDLAGLVYQMLSIPSGEEVINKRGKKQDAEDSFYNDWFDEEMCSVELWEKYKRYIALG